MGKERVWGEGNSSEKVRVAIIGRGVASSIQYLN